MEQPRIVSRDEWLAARKALLAREKAHTREGDALSADRRRLPMVKVETSSYMFDTADGRRSLADLFEGRSQLIVYHFMMGPGWAEGCPSCSFLMDHLDGVLTHLANRDVTLVAVSRATKHCEWASPIDWWRMVRPSTPRSRWRPRSPRSPSGACDLIDAAASTNGACRSTRHWPTRPNWVWSRSARVRRKPVPPGLPPARAGTANDAQRTLTRSTTNTNVSPPLMTPPAPLLP